MRETVGDTLILFALLAVMGGLFGRDSAVLVASAPMFIGGLLLRRGRPSAGLLNIAIPLPKLPPMVLAPTIAVVVVATRFLVLS